MISNPTLYRQLEIGASFESLPFSSNYEDVNFIRTLGDQTFRDRDTVQGGGMAIEASN